MGYCFTCGGEGLFDEVCPECGHPSKLESINTSNRKESNIVVKKFTEEYSKGRPLIPSKYQGVAWHRSILEKDNTDKLPSKYSDKSAPDDRMFIRYLDQLEKINYIFANGSIPGKSAIIIAPAGYSKETFAYSCMQRALEAGFTVAPLLDTTEAKRLLVLASERVDYKLYNTIKYDDYITSDVVFLSVTHMYNRFESYSIIEEILNRRSRLGLSTFILSRYPLDDIYRWDKSNSLEVMKNGKSNDMQKLPAVIQYLRRV